MLVKSIKFNPRSGTVCLPWLLELGIHDTELMDEKKDTYSVVSQGKGILFGHALLDFQEVDGILYAVHHQRGPLVIVVEDELRNNSPLESDSPQHFCTILHTEHVLCIDEE